MENWLIMAMIGLLSATDLMFYLKQRRMEGAIQLLRWRLAALERKDEDQRAIKAKRQAVNDPFPGIVATHLGAIDQAER